LLLQGDKVVRAANTTLGVKEGEIVVAT